MMPKRPVLIIMHNGFTNGNAHVFSDKQIPVDIDTIVPFVIQSGKVSEGRAISRHVNCYVRVSIWRNKLSMLFFIPVFHF